MAYAILNIGLSVGGGPAKVSQLFKAMRAVRLAAGDDEITSWVGQSATEQTLVVVLEEPLAQAQAELLAAVLEQDCIAQLTSEGEGKLFGPRAEAWGPFDIDQFITKRQAA